MPTPSRPDPAAPSAGRWSFRAGGALTAWTNAWLRGAVSYDAAVSAIRDAGISQVVGLPGNPGSAPVGWALGALRSAGDTPLRLVLPVPGDVRGLPSLPGLADAAIRAGQLVVGPGLVMLPDAEQPAEQQWLCCDLSPVAATATPGEQLTVAQASGALRVAVLEATDALATLDVARWNPAVDSLAHREQRVCLPPDHDPAAAALATRCARLAAILELAGADAPGGAINAFGAGHRDAALRPLSVAVREGLMTCFSAVPAGRSVHR